MNQDADLVVFVHTMQGVALSYFDMPFLRLAGWSEQIVHHGAPFRRTVSNAAFRDCWTVNFWKRFPEAVG